MAEIKYKELKQLLLKEQQGTLTAAELEKLDEWYKAFDQTHQDFQLFRNSAHEEQFRERLFNRISRSGFLNDTVVQKSGSFRRPLSWISVAATLFLILGVALLWNSQLNSSNKISWLSAQTNKGNVKKIKLSDGSVIWLNADSKLRYPDHFDVDKREVYLEGEAYFDIAHDPARPFKVKTDFLTTNVLGTAFLVTAYKNTPLRAVTVARGKVEVAHGKLALGLLTPNKRVEYHVNDGKNAISTVDATTITGWKDGKLQFVNQDMQDISDRLNRWYGYSFSFENGSLINCRYTATFNSRITLSELLKVMKAISLVDYRLDTMKKTVTFLGSGCNE